MNIEKFKHQHTDILSSIARLRQLSHAGVAENAAAIAAQIVEVSGIIKLHLAVEDRSLYPALEASADTRLVNMSRAYRTEMQDIAQAYLGFAAKWNTARQVAREPEGFRRDANQVLRHLFERIKREDREFYPAIDAVAVAA
ncbi:hemerythrin domain-containing protein [Massilia oculi]|uniref:Hemerythrin domain-containing protein n=1 Tax=Massilia hydrophila TaxID=3044279 RepID=A0ABS7YG30_9BURK|nr:hemerythrin domain-containing protein [Massilia oculi]